MEDKSIKLFESKQIRTAWVEEQEKWYFSVVDVIGVLVDSADYLTARKYWNKLKQRLTEEGNQTVTNCHQLKMTAADGKVARVAREELEAQTGKKVVSPLSAKRFFESQKPSLPFEENKDEQ